MTQNFWTEEMLKIWQVYDRQTTDGLQSQFGSGELIIINSMCCIKYNLFIVNIYNIHKWSCMECQWENIKKIYIQILCNIYFATSSGLCIIRTAASAASFLPSDRSGLGTLFHCEGSRYDCICCRALYKYCILENSSV